MLRRHAQLRTVLLLAGDLLGTAFAAGFSYWLRFGSGLFDVSKKWEPSHYIAALTPTLLLCLVAYAVAGNYRPPQARASGSMDLRTTVRGVLAATMLLATATLYYWRVVPFSRGMLLLFPFAAVLPVWCARRLADRVLAALHHRGVGVSSALLAGSGAVAENLEARLAERSWSGIRIEGRVRRAEDLPAAVARHRPAQVFLAFPAGRHEELARALALLADEMVDVRVVPDLGAATTLNLDVSLLGGLPVVTLRETPFTGLNRVLKRAFDLVVGTVLLLLLAPLMSLLAVLVLVTSGRPVLFHQERMGLDGRSFTIHKFRTMRVGAEAETGATWACRGDPRRTPLGGLLRRLSLDELPQLVNVLRGEMSLVGPRPERPVFIERFRVKLPGYMLRHRIPAGLTGLAQVNGCRGDSDLEARLAYDLAYLEGWSLLFDVEILLRTAWHVVFGRNAV